MCGKIFIIIILLFSLSFSQEQGKSKKKDKVDFGGRAEIGLDVEASGWIGGKPLYDSKLKQIGLVEIELKIFPADSIELEFDLEYDHRFTDVNLEKLFVRCNFDNSNARLGYMKKPFTLEEIKSSKNRLLVKKSMLNNILEEFFLLGHDMTAQYRYYFPDVTLIGGYAADGSGRNFLNVMASGNLSEKYKGTAAGMYEVYRKKTGKYDYTHAFFGNLAVEFDGEKTDFETEIIWGTNPEKYADVLVDGLEYGDGENMWGLRFQQSFPIDMGRNGSRKLNAIIPVYEVSYFNDTFKLKEAYLQARAGANVCFTPKNRLQWRTNFEAVVTARNQESDSPTIISQRAISEVLVLW